jgi:hypothetical protein
LDLLEADVGFALRDFAAGDDADFIVGLRVNYQNRDTSHKPCIETLVTSAANLTGPCIFDLITVKENATKKYEPYPMAQGNGDRRRR